MAEKNTLSIQVTAGQVFPSKNADVMMVSVRDDTSENRFSTFPVAADQIQANGNRRTVQLETDKEYDISKPVKGEDGKRVYEHARVTGQDIMNMYEAAKQKAIEEAKQRQGQPKQEQPQETAAKQPNEYLNRVHVKMIHETQKEGMLRVTVHDERSADNYGSFLVPKKNVFDTKDRTTGAPVPDRRNINLGPKDSVIPYSIKGADGKFQAVQMTAGELAEQYRADQKDFMAKRRQAVKDTPVEETHAPAHDGTSFDDEMAIE